MLTLLNLPLIVEDLRLIISDLDELGGLVKREPPDERGPFPLPYDPEVQFCPDRTKPEVFRAYRFQRCWMRLDVSIRHLRNALNGWDVDSLACDDSTRNLLRSLCHFISRIPLNFPPLLPLDKEAVFADVAGNLGILLRQNLADLTGEPVVPPDWLGDEPFRPAGSTKVAPRLSANTPKDKRNEFCFNQWLEGKTLKEIWVLVKEHPEWEQFTAFRAVRGPIAAWAKCLRVEVPRRNGGRPPRKVR